jgi:hypothetical protein
MTSKDLPSKASNLPGNANHHKPGPGKRDLDTLLQTLDPILDPVPYIWVSLPPGETPPFTLSDSIIYQFSEPYFPGGPSNNPTPSAGLTSMSASAPKTRVTMVLPKPALNAFTTTTTRLGIDDETLGLAKGTETAFPCRLITCKVQSSLSAVGMMAKITGELASEAIAVNPVSAFFHDYLFVKEEDAELAMDVLLDLVDEAREKAGLEPLDEEYASDGDEDMSEDDDEDVDDGELYDSDDDEEDEDDDIDEETEQTRKKLEKTSLKDKKKK